jgi:hypothetical protein
MMHWAARPDAADARTAARAAIYVQHALRLDYNLMTD